MFLLSLGHETTFGFQLQPVLSALEPVPFPEITRFDPAVQEQIDKSRSALQSLLLDSASPHTALSEAYGTLGKLYHAYGIWEAGAVCYRNARLLAPQDFRWLYYLGRIYQAKGNLSDSISSFQKALEIQPNHEPARLGLAEAYIARGQLVPAQELLNKVLSENNNSAAALVGLGKCASGRQDFKKAVEYLEKVLTIQPNANVHYPLAIAYRQMGDQVQAAHHLSKIGGESVRVADPLMEEVGELATGRQHFFLRGSNSLRRGDLAGAAQEYKKMVDADRTNPLAHVELGRVLVKIGDLKLAKEEFAEAVRLAPSNSAALYNLGSLFSQAGSTQEAISCYQRALRADPESKEIHFQLANELLRSGNFEESATHYRTVSKLDPENAFARLMSAVVSARLRRYEEALEVLEESHRMFPDDRDISAALARILAACPDDRIRSGKRALQLITQLLRQQETIDIENVEVLAMALSETDSFDRAVEIQQKIIREAKRAGSVEFVAALEQTLEQYRQRKACRQPWRDSDPIFRPMPVSAEPFGSGLGVAAMRNDAGH